MRVVCELRECLSWVRIRWVCGRTRAGDDELVCCVKDLVGVWKRRVCWTCKWVYLPNIHESPGVMPTFCGSNSSQRSFRDVQLSLLNKAGEERHASDFEEGEDDDEGLGR